MLMQNVLIVGGGKGGTSLLKLLLQSDSFKVIGMIDYNEWAEGVLLAQKERISTGREWSSFLTEAVDIVIDTTGDESVFQKIRAKKHDHTVLIPGTVAFIIASLLEDKEELIETLQQESYKQELIFNATHDGMIAIDEKGIVTLLNESAEHMTNLKAKDVVGKHIHETMPSSELIETLHTRRVDKDQKFTLDNGRNIITSRVPLVDEKGHLYGAFSIFKDVTDVAHLAEELTNVKELQTMLQAIIQSSEEAISVVDEKGHGILINKAYTKMTGLKEEDVIGLPATADISEGESMHMKVLKTRRPVRRVRMKVGPHKRDVFVNVAPIIVDGILKGSIGVIHDVSEITELTNALKRARQIIRTLEAKYAFEDIIGSSEAFMLSIQQAKLAAKTPATVLLRGESGTGKELFAHAIHNESDRKYNKFVRVNCAAIPESLLESELFGYEEGAFSGAKRGGKRGLFEEAHNGSIFLDEIGELSANTQAKLLRVLQDSEIIRVGSTVPKPIDVRVIAATNVNLERGITEGKIREDLYYRLSQIPIQIPPLRDRKKDIKELCNHLIRKINADYGRNVEGITDRTLAYLQSYDWPGNVRELENVLGRAIIYMEMNEQLIDVEHIPTLERKKKVASNDEKKVATDKSLALLLEEHEKKILAQALAKNKGSRTKTAKQLGISIRSFYYKLEKYQL